MHFEPHSTLSCNFVTRRKGFVREHGIDGEWRILWVAAARYCRAEPAAAAMCARGGWEGRGALLRISNRKSSGASGRGTLVVRRRMHGSVKPPPHLSATHPPALRLTGGSAKSSVQGIKTPCSGNPLERIFASIGEPQSGAGNEVSNRARYPYLPGGSERGDAGADMHRDSADVVVDLFAFAGMEARTNFDPA
jgi:hypothetical protein